MGHNSPDRFYLCAMLLFILKTAHLWSTWTLSYVTSLCSVHVQPIFLFQPTFVSAHFRFSPFSRVLPARSAHFPWARTMFLPGPAPTFAEPFDLLPSSLSPFFTIIMRWHAVLTLLLALSTASCHLIASPDEFSLVKRDNTSCHDIYNVPKQDQCSFVHANCQTDEFTISRFNYLSIYYCHFKFLSVVPLLVMMVVCFIGLGHTASDYLCPNLYTISKFLKLSDNLAGLTLLALGNGSADVLSTYKAIKLDESNLAISELMGASFFITTVVIGSIAIVLPFKVPDKQFIRNIAFYLVITVLMFVSIILQQLNLVSCILLVFIYTFYVIFVISSHTVQKYKAQKRLRYLRSRNNYNNDYHQSVNEIDDIFLDNIANLPTVDALDNQERSPIIQESNEYDNEYRNFLQSHDHDEQAEHAPVEAGSFGLKVLLKELSKHTIHRGHIYLDENVQRPLTAPAESSLPSFGDLQPPHTHPKAYRDQDELQPVGSNTVAAPYGAVTPKNELLEVALKAILPDPNSFSEGNLFTKAYTLVTFPLVVVLKLCNPVRHQEFIVLLEKKIKEQHTQFGNSAGGGTLEESDYFEFKSDKVLLLIQCFVSLNFINYVLFEGHNSYWFIYFPLGLILSSVATGSLNAFYSINRSLNNVTFFRLKTINYIFSFLGFVSSISWISFFATEIIGILKAISIIYHLSDAILGITIFALGNSIGDFISNLTIATMGMPIMAFGACFGGPLLALSSLGLSGILTNKIDNFGDLRITIEFSRTLIIISSALILNIIVLLVLTIRNDWHLDRKIGFILIGNWILSTILCIIFEIVD